METKHANANRGSGLVAHTAAVIIGRNEGDRFRRCLESLLGRVSRIVYVDSGSTDGSIEYAREHGVDVVELDASIPFTAARARNAGFDRLQALMPNIELVMFVDGDCEVVPDWLPAAEEFLAAHQDYAVACGRRRERFPDASVYNYLCDFEWDTPVGDSTACGGDAVMRAAAFTGVDGFDSTLIAGEEPELCIRLRDAGWKIRRLDEEMTLHDAALSQFGQWWTRTLRGGHAYAEVGTIHSGSLGRHARSKSLKSLLWGLLLPGAALVLSPWTGGLSLVLFALYPLNIFRIAWRLGRGGERRPWTVATFLMLAKTPEALGWLRYRSGRLTGKRSKLIEYKTV